MRTLKTVVYEVSYEFFVNQIMKKIVPTAEFKKCALHGAGSLSEDERKKLTSTIVIFIGIDYIGSIKRPITNETLNNFVIAVCFRAMSKQ